MYHVVYGLIKFLSWFPLPVLYFFSDFLYFLTYYIFRYRRKVAMANVALAFPEKSEKERTRIVKDSYHRLIDTFMETIKFFSWRYENIRDRVTVDLSGLEKGYATGKPVHAIGMHNFNWEYCNWWISNNCPVPFLGIYMPAGNKIIDRMMIKMRSRYGSILIPATDFKKNYEAYAKTQHLLGSVADQSPGNPLNAWWLDFFGRKTAFIRGAERGAALVDAAVVFVHFYGTKRGHYHADTVFITEDAASMTEGRLTKQYAAYVEASIRKKPSNYLWTHRRWKHEWKPEYADITI